MTRVILDILGICEMRWPESDENRIADHTFWYSDISAGVQEQGVETLVTIKMAKFISNFVPLSQQVMLVQFLTSPVNINIIDDEEIEEFYKSII